MENLTARNELRDNASIDLLSPPPVTDYYEGMNRVIITAIICASILCLVNVIIFIYNLRRIITNVRSTFIPQTLVMVGIYPVISLASLITLLIPKSFLICDTIMHISFTICACQFFVLCLRYVGGEEHFLKQAEAETMTIRTPPLCCCLMCIKPFSITKEKIQIVRCLIFQMPFVHSFIMMALNIVYLEDFEIYENVLLYFAPFIIISFGLGVWGLNILIRMVHKFAPDCNIKPKYFCIQLVLIICKLQSLIFNLSLKATDFGGIYPNINEVYRQVIMQLSILCETFILSLLAYKVYQKPSWS